MPWTNLICSGGRTTPEIMSGFHSLPSDKWSEKHEKWTHWYVYKTSRCAWHWLQKRQLRIQAKQPNLACTLSYRRGIVTTYMYMYHSAVHGSTQETVPQGKYKKINYNYNNTNIAFSETFDCRMYQLGLLLLLQYSSKASYQPLARQDSHLARA